MQATETYVNYICEGACPKAISMETVKTATQEDVVLQDVMAAITSGQWYKYKHISTVRASS